MEEQLIVTVGKDTTIEGIKIDWDATKDSVFNDPTDHLNSLDTIGVFCTREIRFKHIGCTEYIEKSYPVYLEEETNRFFYVKD